MKKHGQNNVEFAILLGLLGIICLFGLKLLGDNISQLFQNGSNIIQTNEPFKWPVQAQSISSTKPSTTTNSITGVNLTGIASSANPIKTCENGTCTIDFGEYKLTGLPEDFNTLVETVGTSGGNQKFCDMLVQLAMQLKAQGNQQGYQDYMDMANLGYFIAQVQNQAEEMAQSCTISTKADCLHAAYWGEQISFNIPSNVSSIITQNYNLSSYDTIQGAIIEMTDLGSARYELINDPTDYNNKKNIIPAYALVDKYDIIMNNPNIPDSLKNITSAIYSNMSNLNNNLSRKIMSIGDVSTYGSVSFGVFDPFTGQSVNLTVNAAKSPDDLLHPKTSFNNDVNSTIICVSGKNRSDFKSCY